MATCTASSTTVKDGCRVVANPLGYASKGEQDNFDPALLVEVPRRRS